MRDSVPLNQPTRAAASQIVFGHDCISGEPIAVDRPFFENLHVHVRGSTGSGKTSQAILPFVLQLLALPPAKSNQRPDPIFIIDLAGDQANFHAIRKAARLAGRKFRFLSLDNGHDSDYFNPFQGLDPNRQTVLELANMLVEAFNLDYGMFYGADYFASQNTKALVAAAKEFVGRPQPLSISLDDFADELNRRKVPDAEQIRTTFLFLRQYSQLKPELAPSAEELIDISRAIEEGEVIYFFLPAMSQQITVRPVAGLALYTIEKTARRRKGQGQPVKKSWVIVDEFQELSGKSFGSFLIMCRSVGLTLFLANQHNSQLRTRDLDLQPIVSTNTRLKLYFTVDGKDEIEELQQMAKTKRILLKSTTDGTSSGTSSGGSFGTTAGETYGGLYPTTHESRASGSNYGSFSGANHSETQTEHIVSELELNDIKEVDAKAGRFYFIQKSGDHFHSPTPVQGMHVIDENAYEQLRSEPLPPRLTPLPNIDVPTTKASKAAKVTRDLAADPARQRELQTLWESIDRRFEFNG